MEDPGLQRRTRISILAPAYNEAATVRESLRALLSLYYPSLEAIVINNGSRDATPDALQEHFDLAPLHAINRRQVEAKPVRSVFRSRPNLVVIDKEIGGKADALNVVLSLATGEPVCAVDSDTLINRTHHSA